MRKYTKPELEYKVFSRENVLTASGGGGSNESSMSLLKKELGSDEKTAAATIIERDWTAMAE